ncbi:MAG TPA: FkbM family methyltransferase, partial [Chitinophagaceae bacterium]|nr:FkbM family methyltransferase [Chitinophagaceae bacterium]
MGIKNPTYLDIGANHPIALSNTYRLYTLGCRGVLIEPNPFLYKKLLQKRKGDKCINIGIAFDENTEADFYIFPEKYHGLNTFSKKEADFWTNTGNEEIGKQNIEKIIRIPLVNINEIMGEYFTPYPNFVSIDVEGLDLQIVKTIDFENFWRKSGFANKR